ncbi:MAG: substrate-binding domain-containing protein [Solirubrobacterales bacterium]
MSARLARRAAAAAAAALAAAALAACGDLETGGDSSTGAGALTEGTSTTAAGDAKPQQDLPEATTGVVRVDGSLDGSLTDDAIVRFGNEATQSGLAVTVDAGRSGESEAFTRLCDGEIDMVDSSREISDAEAAACSANGLQVVDFRIAFDAAVIVTRNESDVGADCVSYDQLRAMFAAGSPVSSWNQVNPSFFPIRLTTTGPEPGNSDFTLFGQEVLGVPDPTLGDFRSDYAARPEDRQIRRQVVGGSNQPGGAPPGVAGIIGFSYYELYEEELRPLEIDGQNGNRCVFPSEETIASELYPLERTLRIYTTQRSLNRQEVQEFLRSYLRNAEDLATRKELIPIGDDIRSQELKRIDDPTAYDKAASGAVSEPNGGTEATTTTAPSGSAPPTTTTTSTTTETTGG